MSCSTGARLVISLDFEMYWGLRSGTGIANRIARLQRVPSIVESTLDLFEKYEINATWATVGLIGLNNLDEAREMIPDCRPDYRDERLDPYKDIQSDAIESLPQEVLFAPAQVNRIATSPGQELASHTFSHMYCLAEGVSRSAFAEDLEMSRKVFERFGVQPRSFVFPRNQDAPWSFELLANQKYRIYRAGGKRWVSRGVARKSTLLRAARVIDSVWPWSRGDLYTLDHEKSDKDLVEAPASRFLRIGSAAGSMYQNLCITNILREIDHAAKHEKTYHLWWHPHNFSINQKVSLQRLELILQHFQRHAERGRITSASMSDLLT